MEDMRCHLAGNPMSEDAACALVVGHLRGKARLEISGRGLHKTEDIFVAILAAFGGSNDIATLQERLPIQTIPRRVCYRLLIEAGRLV